jgi:nicotinate-nucleotide pyrophosphorylase
LHRRKTFLDTCLQWLGQVTLEESQHSKTFLRARAELVVSGLATIPEAIKVIHLHCEFDFMHQATDWPRGPPAQVLAPNVEIELKAKDGDLVSKGATLLVLSGPSHEVSARIT